MRVRQVVRGGSRVTSRRRHGYGRVAIGPGARRPPGLPRRGRPALTSIYGTETGFIHKTTLYVAPRHGVGSALVFSVRPPYPTHAPRAPSVQQVDRRQHHVRVRGTVCVSVYYCINNNTSCVCVCVCVLTRLRPQQTVYVRVRSARGVRKIVTRIRLPAVFVRPRTTPHRP